MPVAEEELVREALALGVRLRYLRKGIGLTQEKLAEAADLDRTHYQLLEAGLSDRHKRTPSNPRFATLLSLAQVLEVDVTELLGGPPRVDWDRQDRDPRPKIG